MNDPLCLNETKATWERSVLPFGASDSREPLLTSLPGVSSSLEGAKEIKEPGNDPIVPYFQIHHGCRKLALHRSPSKECQRYKFPSLVCIKCQTLPCLSSPFFTKQSTIWWKTTTENRNTTKSFKAAKRAVKTKLILCVNWIEIPQSWRATVNMDIKADWEVCK